MKVPVINDRLELRDILGKSLQLVQEETNEDIRFKFDRKPKSYIIESNLNKEFTFSNESPVKAKIVDTKDSTLKTLSLNFERQNINLYLDVSDDRFWIAHSLYPTNVTDRIINQFITANASRLDFPWFSSKNIEKIGKLGKETGFNLKFKDYFLEEQSQDYENKLQKISMRFWGGQSSAVIAHLRNKNEITKGISLSALGLRYNTQEGYIKTNISNHGKFVAIKGDSISSYLTLISKIKNDYSKFINNLELNYRLNYQKTNVGFKLNGSFVLIEFKNPIENLNQFADKLTSSSIPFRLWGIKEEIDKSFIKIKGIDLHTYHKVNIELTNNWMRIFLPSESCGNVISRLFTNLQNYFDSEIKLRGYDNEELI